MANDSLKTTLEDLKDLNFLLTRFNPRSLNHDDLDILVRQSDFVKSIIILERLGYKQFSHDYALGGRIEGMQVNLTKPGRIKIDLHQDFTWRRKQYLGLYKLWENSKKNRLDPVWDAFLVMINVIFEKTYFMPDEFEIFSLQWQKVRSSPEFFQQIAKYGWSNTFFRFEKWMDGISPNVKFPLFLPVKLIFYSYREKFDFVSFVYYVFFRARFFLTGNLPYDVIL